jgi:regulator of replication initiation timing
MLEDIDMNAILGEGARKQVRQLLNLVEKLSADLRALREENQILRDENNRLKGEQGKPDTKANKKNQRGRLLIHQKLK